MFAFSFSTMMGLFFSGIAFVVVMIVVAAKLAMKDKPEAQQKAKNVAGDLAMKATGAIISRIFKR